METFQIEIKETLSKTIKIAASSLEEAVSKVKSLYDSEEIILDWSDYVNTEIEELK